MIVFKSLSKIRTKIREKLDADFDFRNFACIQRNEKKSKIACHSYFVRKETKWNKIFM